MSGLLVDNSSLQAHVDTCTVCESIYPNPGELNFEPETQSVLERLKAHLESAADVSAMDQKLVCELQRIKALKLYIQLEIDDHPGSLLRISVHLPLLDVDSSNGLADIAVQYPTYLSRADGEKLMLEVTDAANGARADGLSAVDNAGYIVDVACRITKLTAALWQAAEVARTSRLTEKSDEEDYGELQRVWFWFPSLSTREKRKDLVNYAARWRLTGFVLAGMYSGLPWKVSCPKVNSWIGKPGLLCLEGTSRQAEDYMSAIKSESWGDIPSYQKKGWSAATTTYISTVITNPPTVTERYRQPISSRAFTDMQEITHLIDQHGQRGNRGDMSQVRSWMDSHGVGDAWGSVVVNTGVGLGN